MEKKGNNLSEGLINENPSTNYDDLLEFGNLNSEMEKHEQNNYLNLDASDNQTYFAENRKQAKYAKLDEDDKMPNLRNIRQEANVNMNKNVDRTSLAVQSQASQSQKTAVDSLNQPFLDQPTKNNNKSPAQNTNLPQFQKHQYQANQNIQNYTGPTFSVRQICDYCAAAQEIPNGLPQYRCYNCKNVVKSSNIYYQMFICGSCGSQVMYQQGISNLIQCTRCNIINQVPSAGQNGSFNLQNPQSYPKSMMKQPHTAHFVPHSSQQISKPSSQTEQTKRPIFQNAQNLSPQQINNPENVHSLPKDKPENANQSEASTIFDEFK